MRVTLVRSLACVFAGTTSSLAVAWALALLCPLPRDWPGLFSIDRRDQPWMAHGKTGLGWAHLTLYGASGLTDAGRAMAQPLPRWIDTPREGPPESRCLSIVGAGWPMVCLRAECVGLGHDQPPPSRGWHSGLGPQWIEWQPWHGAIGADDAAPTNPSFQSVLPIGIVWPGLIVNVMFWSVIWASPMLFFASRRAIRKRRGRCPACGYDLRRDIDAGCPECGWRR